MADVRGDDVMETSAGLRERALVRLTKQTYGDFRDAGAIKAWARWIAAELHAIHGATSRQNTSKQLHKEEQS